MNMQASLFSPASTVAPPYLAAPPAESKLSERAMLARVIVRKWSARKTDKRVTRQVNESHHAASDAGRYNKRLLPRDALAKIDSIESEARGVHYSRTLPWSDDGPRILSARLFVDYSKEMRRLKAEFESAVADFVAGYPAFKAQAQADLNGLYNEADYPHAADIAGRFEFRFAIMNLPDAADFRVELDAGQLADIRAAIDSDTREALAAATRDVWQRVAEAVGHMATKLRAYQPGGDGKRADGIFRDSLVENVRSLVGLLPSLNIANDPALAKIADRMSAELCRDDAKELRENESARASVAAAAESILADVSAYL
jgi:hypothetical protein